MRLIPAALLPLLAAACGPLAELSLPAPLAAAADPVAGVRAATTGPNVRHTPRPITDPGDWRSLNDAQKEATK
ncbi:hypothetical protein [Seohaeicola zhoushanensis]|uniref:Uncharacterized protein n=1 Tax=Seohaeicola zhoushanensis TaxID=1569283 RepID=A0A8J3GWN8_9RHOB|nr:hypothetical protein [Seohaeicola zhoushanensis]GHF49613.1 hypothetical protein GCM10017056_21760 [Seohaeicola zhoushanensis]